MKKYLLFDLDGTLTDSMPGITSCVAYALQHFGIEETDMQKLTCFVGPPLRWSFQEYYGFTEEMAEEAVRKYREKFEAGGMFDNSVYEGIPHLLEACKSTGKKLLLATSKPERYAKLIMDHFDLSPYFDDIQGSSMDGSKDNKTEVMKSVIRVNGIQNLDEAVMIGDREHDAEGAKNCQVDFLGVLYGYGSREELVSHGAKWIAGSVGELEKILLAM